MRPLLVIGAGGALLVWYLDSQAKKAGLTLQAYLSNMFNPPPLSTPPAGINPNPIGPAPTPPAPVNTNTLAAIYSRMVADANAPTAGLTAWGWNYSLARVTSQTPLAPDDPSLAAAWAAQSLDPTTNMSANQYWSVMGPALGAAYGLSGLRGLGSAYYNRQHGGWAV